MFSIRTEHRGGLDVSFKHITTEWQLLLNQQQDPKAKPKSLYTDMSLCRPSLSAEEQIFFFCVCHDLDSFVVRGRLLWRDVGSVLGECTSKSLFYLFKWDGNIFSRRYPLKSVRKTTLQANTQYLVTEHATTRHVFDMKLKGTDGWRAACYLYATSNNIT